MGRTMARLRDVTILKEATRYQATRRVQESMFVRRVCRGKKSLVLYRGWVARLLTENGSLFLLRLWWYVAAVAMG